jgi:hypothetical protein
MTIDFALAITGKREGGLQSRNLIQLLRHRTGMMQITVAGEISIIVSYIIQIYKNVVNRKHYE